MSETTNAARMRGANARDAIITGSENDHIVGLAGDDYVEAGLGDDFVEGGAGDDRLIGDSSHLTWSVGDLITMQEDRDVTVTFDHETAGHLNAIGYYKVNAETGEIYDVGVLWENASLTGDGGDLIAGASRATIETETGDQLGFFLISNGYSRNDFESLRDGAFVFRNAEGAPATINDAAPALVFLGDDGAATPIDGPIFHSAAYGDRVQLNPDAIVHTVGLLNSDDGQIQLGFEDLLGGGDNDFDDGVFTVDIGEATATALNAHFQENTADATEAVAVDNPDTAVNPERTADRLHGEDGADTLEGQQGNDLLVGDRAGNEWRLVDGEWVYDESLQQSGGEQDIHDDLLIGGAGNDVLNGGLGDDSHYGGAGFDRINAGAGRDFADGGDGDDAVNLEDGADIGLGGRGADTIHAGAGDDVVYGDLGDVLDNGDYGSDPHAGIGFSFLGREGAWTGGEPATDADQIQTRSISQTVETRAGETYSMNFDLALGSLASAGAASVEVYWNGSLIDTIEPGGALFERYNLNVTGTGGEDVLEFREIVDLGALRPAEAVYTSESSLTVNGETLSVMGFAPGQANLYQVIGDQFFIFDTETKSYEAVGDSLGGNINAAGFNPANNLVYGFASGGGADALGNVFERNDLMAIDAEGNSYRLGHVPLSTELGGGNVYIGDFGPDGQLYVMNGGHRGELFRIDVNAAGGSGDIAFDTVPLPADQIGWFADWAWVDSEQAFIGVGGDGNVYAIDPFNLTDGRATVAATAITTTVTAQGEISGVPLGGAWGAVFTDADGNLYAGLNSGDHDLDASTGHGGAIYQITGFREGEAQAVLLAEAPRTSSNDGISDPRSISAFATTDGDASVLVRNVSLTGSTGENDLITGGLGDDRLFGEGGDDAIHGQEGDDAIDGGVGADALFGDGGDDFVTGGEGDDHLEGGAGADRLFGNVGADTLMGGADADVLSGGDGGDKLVGGAGRDRLEGGAGDDHLWGGEWSADGAGDAFVFSPGSGQDMVHDFEVDHDVIDLTAYGLSWDELAPHIHDHGWAVSIELGALGGADGDRIFLTNVASDQISSDNFELGD